MFIKKRVNSMLKKVFITLFLSSAVLLSSIQSAFSMRQPAMERSLQILQNAERTLRKVRPNKGGHRHKALRHIQDAMYEIRAGIEFANRRPAGGQFKHNKKMSKEERKARKKMLKEQRNSKEGRTHTHDYDERKYAEEDERRKQELKEERERRAKILREKRNVKEGRAHEYGERKYTEEDEHRKEEEYMKNRY